ncbi:MAG: helix-turn-helix domain-containing protein [Marivibrio sp.]|uniref:TetR/AcrR family transcriptional regulator n=1 Tax=Marivibrio sp. TaxID=2039719 RepID=UPI0032EF9B21
MPRPKAFDPERALDQAMQAFWAQGYEATSIDDLVRTTGVNRASLYGAFGDKHALFLKALERYTGAGLFAALDLDDETISTRDMLSRLFDRLIARCLDGRGAGCLITNTICEFGARDEAVLAAARRALARMENALDLVVRRGQARGEVDADAKPREVARFLLNAMQGLQVIAKVNPDERALRQIATRTLATV